MRYLPHPPSPPAHHHYHHCSYSDSESDQDEWAHLNQYRNRRRNSSQDSSFNDGQDLYTYGSQSKEDRGSSSGGGSGAGVGVGGRGNNKSMICKPVAKSRAGMGAFERSGTVANASNTDSVAVDVAAAAATAGSSGGQTNANTASQSALSEFYRAIRKAYRSSYSLMMSVRALLSIGTYRNLLGAMTGLYFTVTGVQFWGTKYLSVALKAPLPLVNTLFILCAATGPTLGVFFGGWIVDLCGGYKGPHQRVIALEICSTFGVLACIFALPVTFLSNIYLVVAFLWMVLFFGGSMLPACSGIIVSIVPRDFRPTSSSLSLVVFNMFGYCMSLVLSGSLMQVRSRSDLPRIVRQ